jgi:hypothetical protein
MLVLVGSMLGLIGSLILVNLQSIKSSIRSFSERADKHETELKALQSEFSRCKVDCERTFVDSELFLRETGWTRRSMEQLCASVNRLEGKLTVTDKLPEICGEIARTIVAGMRNGENPK